MDSIAKPDASHHQGRGVLLSKEEVLRERERKVTWARTCEKEAWGTSLVILDRVSSNKIQASQEKILANSNI